MDKTGIDLEQAFSGNDLHAVQCFVVDQQNLILKGWREGSLEDFRFSLQRLLQKSHRAKRQLINGEGELAYQMGVLEGWLQAFRTLYDEERTESGILDLVAAEDGNAARVIRFLHGHGRTIRHGELADALGMSHDALTDAMKPIIACGAITASRTGKNTRYTLTKAGQRAFSRLIPCGPDME